ncbi:substrate-binding domain-containing protein [Thermaerobacter subterraneus]|uniref:Periplasmic molybdate-binding protein n=1 Tax=Thermaerobacter subterraneus DSM 13965 TaxID=867903 RepID=K6NZQ8_9FIRM|nr:substrate-binding domain-containing protein [Thermaerobacter subterraneus]EKP94360.1 periplasmic molybdate-binding protein [Thermaerobacter subterraneus DSM 13965]
MTGRWNRRDHPDRPSRRPLHRPGDQPAPDGGAPGRRDGEAGPEARGRARPGREGVASRLREARRRLGLSQRELAVRAGVSRQAIGAIEAGRMTPSLAVAMRLARALGCRVEDLFRLDEPAPEMVVELAPATALATPRQDRDGGPVPAGAGARILVGRVGGRWVGHLLQGDGAFTPGLVPAGARLLAPAGGGPAPGPGAGGRWRAALLEPPGDLARSILIAGCAPELSLWSRALGAGRYGVTLHRIPANSRQALELLRAGMVHGAGVHLAGSAGEPDNLPLIRAVLEGLEAVVVRLGVWEEGLVVAPGNPLGLRGVADLARPGVVVVNREPGAGCRALLEQSLAVAGIPPAAVAGFDRQAADHLEVARAVARGQAHAGITTAAVAAAYGLDFIPFRSVAYDLVFLRSVLDEPAVQALLGSLGDAWVRRQLAALGGFDTSATGTVTARIPLMLESPGP